MSGKNIYQDLRFFHGALQLYPYAKWIHILLIKGAV